MLRARASPLSHLCEMLPSICTLSSHWRLRLDTKRCQDELLIGVVRSKLRSTTVVVCSVYVRRLRVAVFLITCHRVLWKFFTAAAVVLDHFCSLQSSRFACTKLACVDNHKTKIPSQASRYIKFGWRTTRRYVATLRQTEIKMPLLWHYNTKSDFEILFCNQIIERACYRLVGSSYERHLFICNTFSFHYSGFVLTVMHRPFLEICGCIQYSDDECLENLLGFHR